MANQVDGRIVGKPTLLVTYVSKIDAQAILSALGTSGYPLEDVSVYYRVAGSDQVIDAATGQVAAGQAITTEDLGSKELEKLDTLVLLHPDARQFMEVQNALKPFGDADIKYAEQTIAGGHTDAEVNASDTPSA
ncbi:MAG: hypothetical protein ABI670_09610 [Chloroflexota bacterium]